MADKEISIHDNEIMSYRMLLPEKKMVIETAYKGERIDIVFDEVLAYSFDNFQSEQNILFEAVDSSIEGFVNWYSRNTETQKAFENGFPIQGIKEPGELKTFFKKEGYRYYELNASVGLDGFVIAKRMKLVRLSAPGNAD